MENSKSNKRLKPLERVKGIEPSYSAWKAAALPLSYTRVRPINYHATPAASTTLNLARAGPGLNRRRFPAYIGISINRKEVIQCLIPSAVTSLGSPAKPVWLRNRALSAPGPASAKNRGATGVIPPRPFCDLRHDAALKSVFKSWEIRFWEIRSRQR